MKTKNLKRPNSASQLKPLLTIAYYALKAQLRNRATIFFGFAFPLMFIAVFGLFGNSDLNVSIGIPQKQQSGPIYQALASIEAVKIVAGSKDELKLKLTQGRLAGVLLLENQKQSVPQLFISQANPQQAAAVSSLVSGVVDKLNLQLANVKDPHFNLKIQTVSGQTFRFIDFFLPGMIGFALLTTAVTSTGFGLIFLKKTLVLKRIFATPTKGLTILFGQGAARLVIALAQTLVILAVGVFAFKFSLVNGVVTIAQILILAIIGLVGFLGFGLFIAGIANDENTIAPISQLIVLPQFLVAGTFFPIDSMPSWIQPSVNLLPLAFFNTAIRKITIEGLSFEHLLPQILGLGVWAIIAYTAAAKTFRWE